jgi:hypothetical protein
VTSRLSVVHTRRSKTGLALGQDCFLVAVGLFLGVELYIVLALVAIAIP